MGEDPWSQARAPPDEVALLLPNVQVVKDGDAEESQHAAPPSTAVLPVKVQPEKVGAAWSLHSTPPPPPSSAVLLVKVQLLRAGAELSAQ